MKDIRVTSTISSQQQYKINSSIIFNYLRDKSPLSRKQISNNLGVSAPVVSKVIEVLINEGLVVEKGKVKTQRGKRPIILEIKGDDKFVIGIDLGKEKLRMSLTDFSGVMVERYVGFEMVKDIENLDKKIANEVKKFLSKTKFKKPVKMKDIKSICIGFPASINPINGMIVEGTLYRNWGNLNLKEVLEKKFNIPIYIENDVNLSSIAEKRFGKGKKFKNIIFMEISNGIGIGIILEDYIYKGSKGSAGEIAYKIIGRENLGFKIKNKGFFEKYASMEGLKNIFINAIKDGMESSVKDIVSDNLKNIEPYMIIDAVNQGDKLSKNILEEVLDLLSLSLIDLILILDPEIIVLGGDILNLPKKEDFLLKPIIKNLKNIIPFEIPLIEFSSMGEDACIIGASDFAINSQIISRFPYKI
jgi:predicted NBD/HSP70 family sugar kinase